MVGSGSTHQPYKSQAIDNAEKMKIDSAFHKTGSRQVVKILASYSRQQTVAALIAVMTIVSLIAPPAFAASYQPHSSIQQAAEQYAKKMFVKKGLNQVKATAGSLDSRLKLARCDIPLTSSSNQSGGANRVTVLVACKGQKPWKLYVPVAVNAQGHVAISKHSLQRGTVIQRSDIKLVKRPLTDLRGQYVSDAKQVVGMELKRPVTPDTIMTLNMLAKPKIVRRGQTVAIRAKMAGLQVQMMGKALSDGSSGDYIRVENTRSKRTIEGMINEDGSITVN